MLLAPLSLFLSLFAALVDIVYFNFPIFLSVLLSLSFRSPFSILFAICTNPLSSLLFELWFSANSILFLFKFWLNFSLILLYFYILYCLHYSPSTLINFGFVFGNKLLVSAINLCQSQFFYVSNLLLTFCIYSFSVQKPSIFAPRKLSALGT